MLGFLVHDKSKRERTTLSTSNLSDPLYGPSVLVMRRLGVVVGFGRRSDEDLL